MQLQLLFLVLVLLVIQAAGARSLSVSSYYRTPERNAAVGGVPTSLHLQGLAIDLVGGQADILAVAGLWRALGLDAVVESDHLHLELDGPAVRA